MPGPHLADKSKGHQALCEQEGPITYDSRRVRCDECIVILQRARKERQMIELAQEQANLLLRKKKKRIERYHTLRPTR